MKAEAQPTNGATREAELRRPAVIGSGDLLGVAPEIVQKEI